MVDSTTGIGSIQNITQANKTQGPGSRERSEEAREKKASQVETDTVEISEEAIQKASEEAQAALQRDRDTTLGLDPSFDEEI